MTSTTHLIRTRTRDPLLLTAGATYVGVWLAGLATAPASPGLTASAAELHAHYVANADAAVVQSLLVHGIAGVAIGAFAWALAKSLGSGRGAAVGRAIRVSGMTSAVISLGQVALLQRLIAGIGGADPARTAALVDAINMADAAKLLAIGATIAAATRAAARRDALPRWLLRGGAGLAVLLPMSGAAFPLRSPQLFPLLYLSLPLLLAWVATVTVILPRRSRV